MSGSGSVLAGVQFVAELVSLIQFSATAENLEHPTPLPVTSTYRRPLCSVVATYFKRHGCIVVFLHMCAKIMWILSSVLAVPLDTGAQQSPALVHVKMSGTCMQSIPVVLVSCQHNLSPLLYVSPPVLDISPPLLAVSSLLLSISHSQPASLLFDVSFLFLCADVADSPPVHYYKMMFCMHWGTLREHNPDGSDDCEVYLQQVTYQ